MSWWRLSAHLPGSPSQVRAAWTSPGWSLARPPGRSVLRPHRLSPGSPAPGPELALRICAVVCRTQGDRPLLSKVSLARIQVMVLLLHPSSLSLSFWGTPWAGRTKSWG